LGPHNGPNLAAAIAVSGLLREAEIFAEQAIGLLEKSPTPQDRVALRALQTLVSGASAGTADSTKSSSRTTIRQVNSAKTGAASLDRLGFTDLVVSSPAADEPKQPTGGPRVIIYTHYDPKTPQAVLGRAKLIATSIFASIGVPVVWRSGVIHQIGGEGAVSIEMQLDAQMSAEFHPGALAYAVPQVNSGTRIHVFIDRVLEGRFPSTAGNLLGYVMVHEITHILQGIERHSAEGIMKANWDEHDRREMFRRKLPFAAIDTELIHAALGKVR